MIQSMKKKQKWSVVMTSSWPFRFSSTPTGIMCRQFAFHPIRPPEIGPAPRVCPRPEAVCVSDRLFELGHGAVSSSTRRFSPGSGAKSPEEIRHVAHGDRRGPGKGPWRDHKAGAVGQPPARPPRAYVGLDRYGEFFHGLSVGKAQFVVRPENHPPFLAGVRRGQLQPVKFQLAFQARRS